MPTALESAPGSPFGVVVTADGRWSFVALPGPVSIGVFRIGRSALPALVRQVYVYLTGQPLGEVLTHDGRASGATSSLGVVDVAAALAGRPALLGYLPAGFPREMALEPDGRTLLVANYSSGQLEAVGVADLP